MVSRWIGITALSAVVMTGCFAGVRANDPVMGFIFKDVQAPTPNNVGNGGSISKTGTATCTEILGWVATGDCSVATAAKNGGITQVSTVDHHTHSILGIYATYTTKVGGN